MGIRCGIELFVLGFGVLLSFCFWRRRWAFGDWEVGRLVSDCSKRFLGPYIWGLLAGGATGGVYLVFVSDLFSLS